MEKDTVSVYFVRSAVARLEQAARQRALSSAGISSELLAEPRARVPAHVFSALWLAVAREIDDEFFGLDARRMKVGSFALLCHAALACGAVERAVKQVLRGFSVFLDDVAGELSLEDGQAVITVHNRIAVPDSRIFADETFLVMVHGLTCWLAGQRIPLRAAEFAHSQPEHASEYRVMYSDVLAFGQPATRIRFDGRFLAQPIGQDLRSMRQFLTTAPQSVFLKYKNEDSMTGRLRRRLRASIAAGEVPLLDDVASEFHMASTTLRRRLNAEGSNYQDVKDALRRDLAIHQLCTTDLPVADIGVQLGFFEPSAFYRAFKKWTGVQPGEYRARSTLR